MIFLTPEFAIIWIRAFKSEKFSFVFLGNFDGSLITIKTISSLISAAIFNSLRCPKWKASNPPRTKTGFFKSKLANG
ncbi:hypothetical protein MHL_2834 [Mesomycoplasma hyopneumoniae 7422]|nr:hypothetical protein MHL_2834 [Mesomycoplasma hyopneumoniae 7422]